MISIGQNPTTNKETRLNGYGSKRSSIGVQFTPKIHNDSTKDVANDKIYLNVQKEKRRIREEYLKRYPGMRAGKWENALAKDGNKTKWLEIKGILTEEEKDILKVQSATKLAALIGNGQLTSVQVTQTFIKASVLAQDLTNCLTEICFDQALERAKELDEYFVKTGKTVGPLHGVPISIKDHIDVKDLDSASGLSSWCFKSIAKKDAIIVHCLRKAGAIIYCKTANPQTLLSIETNNNIYGRTTNPFNSNLSAGGSSGGEGALIAMHASILGVGTDIAGSIRIPALWNGCYGLKPSIGRLPHTGLQGPHQGMDTLMGVCGPLAKNTEDLELFCHTILDQEPWMIEAQTLAIPWRKIHLPLTTSLTIAVMFDDGLCSIHPPIKAALMETVQRLRSRGHQIIEWNTVQSQEADTLLMAMLLQDQGEEYWNLLQESEEPAIPTIDWLLKERIPKNKINKPEDLWKLVRKREEIRQKSLEKLNETSEIDVILCPASPTLASRHDKSRHWGYTSIWNVIDWPAVVFPVKMPEKEIIDQIQWPPSFEPRNSIESQVIQEWSPKSDPERYLNSPIGLQLVGRRLQEEKLLFHLAVVEKALKKE